MLKILALAAAAIVIGAAVLVFPRSSNAPTTNTETPAPVETEAPSTAQTAQQYIDYRDGVIAATAGEKVLFFHAPWCPQCRALEADIKKGPIPAGTTIIKVDYDSNQDLRKKYGVTLQTTLVKVNDQGELIKKYIAYDEPTLQNLINNLL